MGTVSIHGLDVPVLGPADLVLAKVHSGSRQDVSGMLAVCELLADRRDEIVATWTPSSPS